MKRWKFWLIIAAVALFTPFSPVSTFLHVEAFGMYTAYRIHQQDLANEAQRLQAQLQYPEEHKKRMFMLSKESPEQVK